MHPAVLELQSHGFTVTPQALNTIMQWINSVPHIKPEDIGVFWDEGDNVYDIQWRDSGEMAFITVKPDGSVVRADKTSGGTVVPIVLLFGLKPWEALTADEQKAFGGITND